MTTSPGARLREAWQQPVQMPGVFNPLVARLAQRLGFQALYLSGAALSAGLGLPDVGLVGMSEFTQAIREITACSSLPLLCDADTGFGEALHVERTVQLYESAGAAGLHLEDQELPKRCGHLSGKRLVSAETMVGKLRAACTARRDANFVIVARTDARGVEGFDEALRRARLYVEEGADAIFPEALEGEEEFARFARELPGIPLIANMTEFGKGPLLDFSLLGRIGYRVILYPVTALRTALRAVESVLTTIRNEGHQRSELERMLTRRELYDLLDYQGFEERDRRYFG